MKVVVGTLSPVKLEAVRRACAQIFPGIEAEFEGVKANSGISDQPFSDDEMRTGAIGRVAHAKELSPGAHYYVGLEGGAQEMYGDMYNFGWVVVEAADGRRGYGRTFAFALPKAIRDAMVHEGLEQSHATDKVLSKAGTKSGTGTIGPLTNDVVTYVDWYVPAVISAFVPFIRKDLYE